MQLALFVLAITSGGRLVWMMNHANWRVNMRQVHSASSSRGLRLTFSAASATSYCVGLRRCPASPRPRHGQPRPCRSMGVVQGLAAFSMNPKHDPSPPRIWTLSRSHNLLLIQKQFRYFQCGRTDKASLEVEESRYRPVRCGECTLKKGGMHAFVCPLRLGCQHRLRRGRDDDEKP